ncbi:MAG: DUF1232 domain-containing protein [Thermoanaerobaculia bacterium]|nr:DUF1232 domain-containing protein [Thermoanaerobaculia bacterium]
MAEYEEQDASDRADDSVDQAFEARANFATEASDGLPSQGLLSFYDRLRSRLESYLGKHGGAAGDKVSEALLLVPDVFIFLLRLLLDPEVPKAKRALIGSAIAYFVLPVDLLPEAMIGPAGFVDDLVLALAVLSQSFGSDLEPWAGKYWSGSQSLRKVLRDVLQSAHGLLGTDLHHKLRRALAKRGIDLDDAADVLTVQRDETEDRREKESWNGGTDRGYDDPYTDPYDSSVGKEPLSA